LSKKGALLVTTFEVQKHAKIMNIKSQKIINVLSYMLLTIGLVVVGCHQPMSETVKGDTTTYNGGFEQVKDNKPVNWLLYTPATTRNGDFDITVDTTDHVEGRRSLRIAVRQCGDKGGRLSPGISQEIAATQGASYEVSYQLKNTGARYRIHITGVDAWNSDTGVTITNADTLQQWTSYKHSYTLPTHMKRLRIEVNVLSAGVLCIDDIVVKELTTTKN
jgi:hypothetical protein